MDKNEYNIMLCEEIAKKLKAVADKENISVEEYIQNLIISKFEKSEDKKSIFPSVALIKEGLNLDAPINTIKRQGLISKGISSSMDFEVASPPVKPVNPELVQRRKDIEMQMSELSLLIETATEDKKNGYVMQYAQLASELNTLI